jgi:hypothetical protein
LLFQNRIGFWRTTTAPALVIVNSLEAMLGHLARLLSCRSARSMSRCILGGDGLPSLESTFNRIARNATTSAIL